MKLAQLFRKAKVNWGEIGQLPVIQFSVIVEKYLTAEYCDWQEIKYSKESCGKLLHAQNHIGWLWNHSSTDTQGSLCVAGGHGWHTAGHLISIGSAAALTKGPRKWKCTHMRMYVWSKINSVTFTQECVFRHALEVSSEVRTSWSTHRNILHRIDSNSFDQHHQSEPQLLDPQSLQRVL